MKIRCRAHERQSAMHFPVVSARTTIQSCQQSHSSVGLVVDSFEVPAQPANGNIAPTAATYGPSAPYGKRTFPFHKIGTISLLQPPVQLLVKRMRHRPRSSVFGIHTRCCCSCFGLLPILMHAVYELTLRITFSLFLGNPDFHHGLLWD